MPPGQLCPVAVTRIENRVDGARGVVRGQNIHHSLQHIGRVILRNRANRRAKSCPVILPAHIAQDRLLPRVVHDGIELPVGKIPAAAVICNLVGRILPDLADQNRVRLDLPDTLTQACEKRVRQLVDDVQPPAVRAKLQPADDNTVVTVNDIVHIIRVQLVNARQRRDPPPAVVDVWILLEPEPAAVRRGRVMDRLLKIRAAAADMAEYAVENDLHAQRVRRAAERAEIRLRAEHGVDALVITGIVPVRRPCIENRIEI